jgi:pullulanase
MKCVMLYGPFNDNHKGAFLAGLPGGEESIKFGIVGAIKHPQVDNDSVNYSKASWAEQPTQMISYVSCHDDMCLVDRLNASIPGITPQELAKLDKLAQTAVFTSQGIPFIYAGEEVMRDKQGIDNSYKSPDAINAIDWRRKTTNGDIFTYYKRLIDLRKSHPAFRMGNAEMVRKHLEFLPVEGQNLIAFRLKERANGDSWEDIIVAFNSRTTPARLEIPVGKYTVVCKDGVIDVRGLGTQTGPEVIVPGQSALIMYK